MTAHCCLCGRACIPMADYERPVCHRCDDDMAVGLRLTALVRDHVALTPGQQALVEAMRFEEARIYGRTVLESRPPTKAEQDRLARDREIVRRRDEGESLAAIALRLGVCKTTVWNVLGRAS